jgi:lipopolysaccharide export system protein LptA
LPACAGSWTLETGLFLMRWQRIARWALAVFVLAFAAMVVVALRRPARPVVKSQTPRVDQKTIVEVGPLTHTRTNPDGSIAFVLEGKRQLVYPDGRNVLFEAELTVPEKNGRTLKVKGGEMEVITPPTGDTQFQTVNITKGARLTSSDGLDVTSDRAAYDQRTAIVTIPGDVQFTRGRLSGSGLGATYDKGRNVLWLLDRASLTVKPDEKGAGAASATAKSIGMARNEHYVRLTENAHVVGEGRTLDANEIVLQLLPDDSTLHGVTLRGNSRITGGGGAAGAEGMSARDIDLTYAPDGRTLQQARLVENAVAQISAGGAPRKVSAATIDLTMGPDGSTVTALNASPNVTLDLPASPDAPARRITSASLAAGGPNGLQTATFAGGVVYREMKSGRRGAPPPTERTATSGRLIVQTQPGLGSLQQADFHGNVHIVDGDTIADAQRAVHQVAQDSFDLSLSPGDPGPPPSMTDGKVLVNARTINFTIGSKKLLAETDVRSSVRPSRPESSKAGAAGQGRGRGTAADTTKMPSLLKQDQAVSVTARKMEYDGARGLATYTGDAKLWQDQTQVQGDVIVVDDQSGNLTAIGHVRSVMFLDEPDEKTKTKAAVQTIATGDKLVYEDATRIATYTTGPTAQAHLVGTEGDVTAEKIQLFLKEGANELDRAEADSKVTVKEGIRTATGQHLIYTPADETYVMTGSPVEVEERKPAECRISSANTLTFRKAADAMTMSAKDAPVKFRQCPPK